MKGRIAESLPKEQLGTLEFLVGEFTSLVTLFPTGRLIPIRYRSVMQGSREACDQYLRTEQFSDVPGVGLVSCTNVYGYNLAEARYKCYSFSSAYEQPVVLTGEWQGERLVLLSEPVVGYGMLDRYRQTFTPAGEGRWRFLEERWEPDGYVKHIVGTYLLGPSTLVP